MKYKKILKTLTENKQIETNLTFLEALYSGKQYIRCLYDRGNQSIEYAVFDIRKDVINEMLTLHDFEFNSDNWEASDTEYFDDI